MGFIFFVPFIPVALICCYLSQPSPWDEVCSNQAINNFICANFSPQRNIRLMFFPAPLHCQEPTSRSQTGKYPRLHISFCYSEPSILLTVLDVECSLSPKLPNILWWLINYKRFQVTSWPPLMSSIWCLMLYIPGFSHPAPYLHR